VLKQGCSEALLDHLLMGGWSPYQFKEKRLPTVAELNDAAPDTPVLVLFAYSVVLLNKAGVAALKLMPESEPAGDGRYEFADEGAVVTGTLAVYANSTQHFFRSRRILQCTIPSAIE
jgi:predicted amidohydrolase YtcJ